MIESFEGVAPKLSAEVFVAENATVIGRVELGEGANIWYGCVLRGDVGAIKIGARTNVQDLSVIHVTGGQYDTTIGEDVTIGHRAILHGCEVHDRVLIGMGAIVLDGAVIESDVLVAAGAVVTPGTRIKSGYLALGSPARALRPLAPTEIDFLKKSAAGYVDLARRHATRTSTI